MNRTSSASAARARSSGVTLVELLVSIAIGSILILGAVTIYVQSRATYRTSDTAARLQEIARYAMDVMEPDIREAGYWGMTNRADYFINRAGLADADAIDGAVTNNCGPDWTVDVERYVDGRESVDAGGSGYDLACPASNPVDGSDVLIVRRASVNLAAPLNGTLQVQSDRLNVQLFSGGTPPAEFPAALSETRNLIVNAYYINREVDGPNGLPRFSLHRQVLIGGGPSVRDEEVIPGVEDMQVQFGIDDNGNGSVDQYVDPESAEFAAATGQVLAVKLWLRVVADETEQDFVNNRAFAYANRDFGAFNDKRRRLVVSKTIQLRNQQPSSI